MKEIKAYIKHHKLSSVTLELKKIEGFPGMSVCEVRGFGWSKSKYEEENEEEALMDYIPHVKVEVVCEDDQEKLIVETIQKTAYTGLRGDGNIYVLEVQKSIRINEEAL